MVWFSGVTIDASVTAIDILVDAVSDINISITFLPRLAIFIMGTLIFALNSCKRLLTKTMRSANGIQSSVNKENCTMPVANSSIGKAAFCNNLSSPLNETV